MSKLLRNSSEHILLIAQIDYLYGDMLKEEMKDFKERRPGTDPEVSEEWTIIRSGIERRRQEEFDKVKERLVDYPEQL